MISFPNAKINIGLYITGKRPDGFHDLETVFYPVTIKDALEIIDHSAKPGVTFTASGLTFGDDDNICTRAYELLQKEFRLPGIAMHLHKAIPIGSGLGGGSADAAMTLQLLNNKYKLDLSQSCLMDFAARLGSDSPFFIINKPCYATGRGEVLEEINLDLSSYNIVIINPGIHISTKWAFSNLQLQPHTSALNKMIQHPVGKWKNLISNDFEKPVFIAYPEIARIKTNLYEKGALYAAMSGSGSSVYGIFRKEDKPGLKWPAEYFMKWN